MESIISAIIAGGLALIGVIITNLSSNKSMENKLVTAQAVTDTKIDTLTTEVRKHNEFAQKIPVMEEKIKSMDKRVGNLENQLQK